MKVVFSKKLVRITCEGNTLSETFIYSKMNKLIQK